MIAKGLSADWFRSMREFMGMDPTSEESWQSTSGIINASTGAFMIPLYTCILFVNTLRGSVECSLMDAFTPIRPFGAILVI